MLSIFKKFQALIIYKPGFLKKPWVLLCTFNLGKPYGIKNDEWNCLIIFWFSPNINLLHPAKNSGPFHCLFIYCQGFFSMIALFLPNFLLHNLIPTLRTCIPIQANHLILLGAIINVNETKSNFIWNWAPNLFVKVSITTKGFINSKTIYIF